MPVENVCQYLFIENIILSFRAVTYIADHQRLQLCIFGGGHSLAYVLDNNVYYLPDFNEQAIQLTTDGIPGEFYNGHNDWVYEGELVQN